ncbi:collagen-like protein [Mucilaginibacter sp.]|uniref:collagen-like triple helix repeat-containing protein n=1 Tax=Mucilaginibacter sp. TaxID=1882438 RepID=UPI00374D1570
MKNLKTTLFVLMAAAIIFTSCGKDGAVGPSGPSGSTGATGPTGATGADGTKIYSGAAAPATTVGANGDFYLNTANSDFYGPKSAAGWGTPTNLKGATGATGAAGAAGAAGSKIYSGSGAPAASVGINGDYYLDVTGYLFYGPKAGGAWSAPINLKGPKGDPGTANVIYSDWYTPPTYTKTTIFGTVNFTADIAASKITQAILDKGAVFVYGKLNGYNPVIWPTDQVSQLPIAINYMSGATPNLDTWSGLCTVGNVRITLTSSTNAYGSISNAHQFRYVIVPGGVHTIGSIDPKNYKQMQQLLGIKD